MGVDLPDEEEGGEETEEEIVTQLLIPLWWRRADFVRAIDGDTIECVVDLGYGVKVSGKNAVVRLLGINTPELNSPDPAVRAKAIQAKDQLATFCSGRRLMLQTFKDAREKYGRYLANVHVITEETSVHAFIDPTSINDHMLDMGLGTRIYT